MPEKDLPLLYQTYQQDIEYSKRGVWGVGSTLVDVGGID